MEGGGIIATKQIMTDEKMRGGIYKMIHIPTRLDYSNSRLAIG
jgi:hypothetical protein